MRPLLPLIFAATTLLAGCAQFMVAEKDQNRSKIYLQKAADELGRKNYQAALKSTREAIKLKPDYAAAYNHLALIYMETKRYEKSEKAFKKALKIKPNYPEAFNNMGVLMNRTRKYKKAISLFKKALKDDDYTTPENAHTNMGFSYLKIGKISNAIRQHIKALDMAPYFCLAHKNLGDTYVKSKKYRKAASSYKRAMTHCPLYQEGHYKYGLALMKSGNSRLARVALEKLVIRHKEGTFVERSNKVLRYLK